MRDFWSQPIVVATYRGLVGALVLAGGAYFGALQGGATAIDALIPAGVAFFGYLALRAGVEGWIDQKAASG